MHPPTINYRNNVSRVLTWPDFNYNKMINSPSALMSGNINFRMQGQPAIKSHNFKSRNLLGTLYNRVCSGRQEEADWWYLAVHRWSHAAYKCTFHLASGKACTCWFASRNSVPMTAVNCVGRSLVQPPFLLFSASLFRMATHFHSRPSLSISILCEQYVGQLNWHSFYVTCAGSFQWPS